MLNQILEETVAKQAAPFVVAMTANSAGVTWSGAAGEISTGTPAAANTLFRIFSMTKAVGATCAMILIDRGLLKLDDLVETYLPEFAQLKVLTGFDGDQPCFRSPKTKTTILHLATHTSGLVYPTWDTKMGNYFRLTNQPPPTEGRWSTLQLPLVFDPGERWGYGIGIDWLGQVVEAIDGRRIDQFCREEIFQPLGMQDTVFELSPDMRDRLAPTVSRGQNGRFSPLNLPIHATPDFYGMGHALHSTPADYLTFLRMFLNKGALDGQTILSPTAIDLMLANHIEPLEVGVMKSVSLRHSADVHLFPSTKKSHSLGFVRVEEDVAGMRSAGSQAWAGLLNTHYWFDPAKDLAAVFMTQTLPFADPLFMSAYNDFEKAVYSWYR